MPPRRSPAQIRSQLRQAQSRARQSQQKLNHAIRGYNRQVDKGNASVEALAASAARLEGTSPAAWAGSDLVDLSQGEAANSVADLTALLGDEEASDHAVEQVQQSHLREVLDELDPEIGARWAGALFALSPANPDAARHF